MLNRVRVKDIGRVNRFTINPEWDNYYLKIQVTFTCSTYRIGCFDYFYYIYYIYIIIKKNKRDLSLLKNKH